MMRNNRKKTINSGDFLGDLRIDNNPRNRFSKNNDKQDNDRNKRAKGNRRFNSNSNSRNFTQRNSTERKPNSYNPENKRQGQSGFQRRTTNNNSRSFSRSTENTSSNYSKREVGSSQHRSFNRHHGNFRSGRNWNQNRRTSGRRGRGSKIDTAMFINKATEKTHEEAYTPKNRFIDFKIEEKLKQNIVKKGFVNPTPIQDQAIPHILEGKDLVGLANTGTGKTGAFLIPLINKVLNDKNQKVLIIAPTRELAMQINEDLKDLTRFLNIWSELIIGGSNMQRQIRGLQRRHNFVVGTPGRIKDMIERGYIKPANFQSLVLDEMDRMLDMGFIEDIKFIVATMPKEKQSLFFSATITKEIDEIINNTLANPMRVQIKSRPTSENVDQDVIRVKQNENKLEVLCDLLNKDDFKKVLIFTRTKRGADNLSEALFKKGFKVRAIHGDKTQFNRQTALANFKASKVNILVATDVAARGLDIKEVSHVINYDQPENYEDYIHRIGRTGRADKKGVALTFVE